MVKSIRDIEKQQDMLKALSHCKLKIRKAILKNADKDLVDAICHCVYNMLHGNVELSETQKGELYKYRHTLRKLIQKQNLNKKKKILVQNGGFLQFLIPAAVSGIASIISSIIPSLISKPANPE